MLNPPKMEEHSLKLERWEEVIAICDAVKTDSTENIIVLKIGNEKVNLHVAKDQATLEILRTMIGKKIAVLKTEKDFLVKEITAKKNSKEDFCK